MSRFVVCEKCGRHAIRGVHTFSKFGVDLLNRKSVNGGITVLAVGNTKNSNKRTV